MESSSSMVVACAFPRARTGTGGSEKETSVVSKVVPVAADLAEVLRLSPKEEAKALIEDDTVEAKIQRK